MATVKMVDINDIAPNPYRNFEIYPMEKVQIAELVKSYTKGDEVRDFGVIPVRRSWYADETYEQAAGHHRLEAMRDMGLEKVRVLIGDHDDDEIVKIMALENTRQKGGNTAAQLDALAGMAQRVAFMLLIDEHGEEFIPMFTDLGPQQWKRGRANMLNGHGVSRNLIEAFEPGLWSAGAIKTMLTTLIDSGEMAKIIDRVQAEVEAIQAEEAAEEERERKAAEAEEKRIAKAEAEARKRAAEADKLAKQRKAAAAESQKKRAAEERKRAEAMAKARAKAAAAEKVRREKADKLAAKRKAETEAIAKSAAEFREKARGLNPEVLHLLKRDDHLEEFRKAVTSKDGQRHFPQAGQPELVREMIEWCEANSRNGRVTTKSIETFMTDKRVEKDAELREMVRRQREREEKASVVRRVDNAIADFRNYAASTAKALQKLGAVLDDEATGDYALGQIASDQRLSDDIDRLENMVAALRGSLTLRKSHYQAYMLRTEIAVN